ncbi:hypothetical protein RB600_004103 [Gaeumannomyces tritici]
MPTGAGGRAQRKTRECVQEPMREKKKKKGTHTECMRDHRSDQWREVRLRPARRGVELACQSVAHGRCALTERSPNRQIYAKDVEYSFTPLRCLDYFWHVRRRRVAKYARLVSGSGRAERQRQGESPHQGVISSFLALHPQASANQPITMSQASEALFQLSHESVKQSEPSVMLDRYIRTQSSSALSALATTGVGRSGEERKAAISEQLAQLQAAMDAKRTEDSA